MEEKKKQKTHKETEKTEKTRILLDESQKNPSTEQGHYNEQTMIVRKSCRGMKVTNHPNNKSQRSHKKLIINH